MNIVEIKTFKFSELSEKAKQVAIDQYRNDEFYPFNDWYDFLESGKQYY